MLSGRHARTGEELGGVQSLARQLRGEFGFVSVDRDKEDNQQLLTFLGAVDRGKCALCNKQSQTLRDTLGKHLG